MDNQDTAKGPQKQSTNLKHRSQSKDTLPNGKSPSVVRSRFRINSKLPKVVKSPSNQCNTTKSGEKIVEKLDNSGENKPSTSKNIHFYSKKKGADKTKPSCIPRRKINSAKEASTKEKPLSVAFKKKTPQHIGERNIQRVQMLINQDYVPEEQPRIRSVARPIPTLGNIYGRVTNADPANINGWFVPANSITSNIRNGSRRQDDAKGSTDNDVEAKLGKRKRADSCISPHKHCTPGTACDWFASEVEYPTRDNESAYHATCPQTYTPVDLPKANNSENSEAIQESPSTRIDNLIKRSPVPKLVEKVCSVTEESTAACHKITSSLVLSAYLKKIESRSTASDLDNHAKKCQYPSNPGIAKASQVAQNKPVPSYVECLSEILQKTTNFEGDGCEDIPKSLSSIAGTDLEIRDELSSECTLDDGSLCDPDFDLCFKCKKTVRPNSKKDESSETTSIADSTLCHYTGDSLFEIDTCIAKHSPYNVILRNNRRHYYAKDHKNWNREKYMKFRRFPSYRFRDDRNLSPMREHVTLRICKRRLSRVWKKTTEWWALWSAKPPQRYKKPCHLRYVQRVSVGKDANIQTNSFKLKETGNGTTPKQKKSQAITIFPYFEASFESYKSEGGTDATASPYEKNKNRNCTLGPSLFPFLYNPERNAFIKETIKSNPIPEFKKQKNKLVDKETQKTDIPDKTSENEMMNTLDDTDSVIQICEISVDDKVTDTEDMLSALKEQMTSTFLHLPVLQVVTMPWIVCDSESKELEKEKNEKETLLKVTTTPNIKTLVMHDSQVTTVETQETTAIGASESNKTNNPLVFLPVHSPLKPLAVSTKKEFVDAGLTAFDSELNNDIRQALPPIVMCKCPIIKPIDCKSLGTDTDEASIQKQPDPSAKLKTYVNTGMLINSIVEKAILRGSPKFSVFADTKSIGNKYTSDVGICATTILKDSVIETEKEILPKRLSASTNTFMKLESKFTEQNSSFATDGDKFSDNGTQYSDNVGGCTLCRSNGIGDSCLMTVRTLTHSAEEMEAQTEISLPGRGSVEVPRSRLPLSVTTSYTVIKPFIDHKPISTYKYLEIKGIPKTEQKMEAIPQKKSSCNTNSNTEHKQVADTALSSALDAVKWINAGYTAETNATTDSGNATTAILKETKSIDNTTQCVTKCVEISQSNQPNPVSPEIIVAVQANTPSANIPTKRDSSDSKTSERKYASKVACSIINSIVYSGFPVDDSTSTVEHLNEPKTIVPLQPKENQATVQMIDGATSDVLVKDVKEITLQANPESCNAATECPREKTNKSASALTSRCILPGLPFYCCENHKYGELSGDCRFIYGVPQCVVHAYNPDVPQKSTLYHTQCIQVQAAEIMTIKMPSRLHLQTQNADINDFKKSQFVSRYYSNNNSDTSGETSAQSNSGGFCTKSEGQEKCSCVSKHKQTNKTIEDLSVMTLNTEICPLHLNEKASFSNHNSPRTISTMTSSCPTSEQQTSMQAFSLPCVSNTTSINHEHFGRNVGLVTSFPTTSVHKKASKIIGENISNATSIDKNCIEQTVGHVTSFRKSPGANKKTSQITSDSVSHSTSLDQDHLVRSIGFTTSSSSRPPINHKHTSNIYRIASAKTSAKQQIAQSIGLITSRQSNPPIHDKACSNIVQCASAKTSMYDEFNTQSVSVNNDETQEFASGTSTHVEEHCVQSVGLINNAWKAKSAIKTIRSPHTFETQSSELGFLLSPKEYEALYKTTRYLSKEAAKATTAIKGEKLGKQQSYQTDAAVEVLLRADMKSAQNMASPAMHSATVMTALSDATSSVFDSGTLTPSCSVKCPLEVPTRDNDTVSSGSVVCLSNPRADSSVKNHLAASCRYYSTLLTKQLDSVKENLTKHLVATSSESPSEPIYCDNCTMKPSAREELACQTYKDTNHTKHKPTVLDPSENETDICRHDKEHLQSVYYMLTAIEGRLRRLKSNVEYKP